MSYYIGWIYHATGYTGRGEELQSGLLPHPRPDITYFAVYPHEVADFDKRAAATRARRDAEIELSEQLQKVEKIKGL